jgi:hypothetical protein
MDPMKVPPEWYLTGPDLTRLRETVAEGATLHGRHRDPVRKMQMPGGLDENEKVELGTVIRRHNELADEHAKLLRKNPLLPENAIKGFDDKD